MGSPYPGGVEHVELRARRLHETGNWLVLTDCSNAFNTVKRTAVLEEVANCVPALTPFVAQYYGTRPADVFFPDGLGGDQDDRLLQRCPARGSYGTSNVLPGVAAGAEMISAGNRGRRGGGLRVHGRCLSRPNGDHGQHG